MGHGSQMVLLCLLGGTACLGMAMPRGQAADDLRRYGDLLKHEYAWGALDQSVDVSALVDEAVAGLPENVDLDELHETIWRIQANFKDADARVSLPEEACNLDACTCSGVSLAALKGQVHTARGSSGGRLYEYAFAICGEVPLSAIPSSCGWTLPPHATVVQWDISPRWGSNNAPKDCKVVVSSASGGHAGGAMSSTKTDAGLTISYTSEQPGLCTHSFVVEITPALATQQPHLTPVQSHGCYYHTHWAAANVSGLGHEPLFAPFLVYETSPGVFVALRPDRTGWIDADHPVLQKIDGVAIAVWVGAAEALVGQRRRAVRLLNDVWRLRQLRELQSAPLHVVDANKVSLELATLHGVAAPEPVVMPGVPARPSYGDGLDAWPRKEMPRSDGVLGNSTIGAQILPGTNVGYLRIPTVQDVPETDLVLANPSESLGLRAVLQAMHADETWSPPGVFATDGLVIDVRGSFGDGSRKIVQALIPYFMSNVDRRNCPLIGSASAALKSRDLPPQWGASGYLETLSAEVRGTPGSDTAAAIRRFNDSFTPTGPDSEDVSRALRDQFDELEYMPIPSVDFVQTEAAQVNVHDWYHYANPVIVLQDEDSQGAVEILLAAFKALAAIVPNIKLMGQTSGGGVTTTGMFNITTGQPFSSSEEYTLPNSKIRVRLAATAAFMPTSGGATYSGHGVTPDIKFDTDPSSLLIGQPDAMLSAALEELSHMTAASRGTTSCPRGAFPTYVDQTSQMCFRAYGQAFDSTAQGDCWRQSGQNICTEVCQDSITHMLRTCANDTYEAIVEYYSKYTMIRGFNARAVLALQIMGPTNCDYSLLSADTRCNPTCSMENLANGTDQRWVDLRKCFDQNAPHHSGSTKTPVPVWNQDTCASDECEQRFRDFASDCRACNTEIEFASFLSLAAKNLVLCREAATSCDSVIGSVRDACCAGVDCASDGYPTICSYSSGLRHFGGSLCQEAVQEAEEVCPLHLLNDTRLQGLYVVSMPVAS
eukprot:COSAG02_NODE_1018_length_15181_cov_18.026389_5_plen_996_part_00